jgi:hypothetical protein
VTTRHGEWKYITPNIRCKVVLSCPRSLYQLVAGWTEYRREEPFSLLYIKPSSLGNTTDIPYSEREQVVRQYRSGQALRVPGD